MDLNQQKEQFSNAFVGAIASTAGLTIADPAPDVESVDFTLGRPDEASPRIDLQLKCSAAAEVTDGNIPFSISVKNYDELRNGRTMVPRILVVVLVPDDPAEWLELNDERMLLRHCAYWMSLEGAEPTANEQSTTVYVPADQHFSVDAVDQLLDVIASGGRP